MKIEGIRGLMCQVNRIKRNDYALWIKKYDTFSMEEMEIIRQRQSAFLQNPLISVIMPVFDPKPKWLIKAIESVCRQSYPHWELCIADDASTNPAIRDILINYSKRDSRIKVVLRNTNGHIAACSNSAMKIASGDWYALLDHDDELAPTALYRVADVINNHPDAEMIYSDEDKISGPGTRSAPYFKPDWNPELFYSHNMFSHLGVYHAGLVKKAGYFREGFEGAQDYDLALRCIEHTSSRYIHHIPRVLYHWRIHKGSTARSVKSKPYAMLAGERALNEHFNRWTLKAEAHLIGYGYRIKYHLPVNPPQVSIIIHTCNGLTQLRPCIESILNLTKYKDYEIIVIVSGTGDQGTLAYLRQQETAFSRLSVVWTDPSNSMVMNNLAIGKARGELIALVSDDVRVFSPEWLDEMAGLAVQPGIGVVGAKLYYTNNTVQHAGIILGSGIHGAFFYAHHGLLKGEKGYFGRASLTNSFSAVTGDCMVVRKSTWEIIHGFNEKELSGACNDIDFCLRVREAGFRSVFTPYAELYRAKSSPSRRNIKQAEHERMLAGTEFLEKRWSPLMTNDPAYNPNLSLEYSDFSLAWPPRIDKI